MKRKSSICFVKLVNCYGVIVASGYIACEDDERFKINTLIRTSAIEKVDFVNNIIETRNTIYEVVDKQIDIQYN